LLLLAPSVADVSEGQTLLRIDNFDAPEDVVQTGLIRASAGATFDLIELRNSKLPQSRNVLNYGSGAAADTAGRKPPRVSRGNTVSQNSALTSGEVTLAAGAATVSTSAVFNNRAFSSSPNHTTKIELQRVASGAGATTRGSLFVDNIVSGTSFDIKSTNASDTSTVRWDLSL
jgi:hypothetical protein